MTTSGSISGKRLKVAKWFRGRSFNHNKPFIYNFNSYGHGVLRNPDPRFIALQEFCNGRPELKSSRIIELVNKVRTCRPRFIFADFECL